MEICSSYLGVVFDIDRFQKLVPIVVQKAKDIMQKHPFDAIAFTGVSGAAIAFILSYELKIPLICVRRDKNDGHHAKVSQMILPYPSVLEGALDAKKYLIVDDFISTGITINRILESINDLFDHGDCVAILLYSVSKDGKSMGWFDNIPIFEIEDGSY